MNYPTYNAPPTLTLSQAEPLLMSGDLVFYRARRNAWRWVDLCRTLFSGAPYVQVSMLYVGTQTCVMTLHKGGITSIPLQSIVKERPVDIFRVNNMNHSRHWFEDGKIIGLSYTIDFTYIMRRLEMYFMKQPVASSTSKLLFRRSNDNDEALLRKITHAICLEASFNDAGFDLCPRVSPNRATPARLSKSALLEHLFTID